MLREPRVAGQTRARRVRCGARAACDSVWPNVNTPRAARRTVTRMETKTDATTATRAGERRERFETSSGVELANDFNPSNTAAIDYERDLGAPGDYPYTRGVRRNLYRGRFWTMRQYAGYATADESNARYKYL